VLALLPGFSAALRMLSPRFFSAVICKQIQRNGDHALLARL
jgi:hypothetical protein